jgi:protocatechuate 3,4-dioxygenase beta subunit
MHMHRRTFLVSLPLAAALTHLRLDAAQDPEFVRAWERAQKERPATLSAVARIAPAGEPGTPLTIRGRVYQTDGRTPAPGVMVFAYQTDREGLYAPRTEPPHTWRLKGWARTGEDGRFQFHTIRPGAYPGRTIAEHVHFSIEGPSLPRRFTPELNFADDPIATAAAKRASDAAGVFGSVRQVQKTADGQLVEFNIRITESGRF